MKANELMVGDWVCYNPHKKFYKIEHPFQFDKAGVCTPIPLTEEILKANDIKENEDLNAEGVHYRKMAAVWNDIKQPCRVYDINNDPIAMFCSNNIKYVHELQHAFRLCKLNELADNFKIE